MANSEDVTFLLVEDDAIDVMAIRRAFAQLEITNGLVVAGNGLEALGMLRGESGFERIARPFVILLDLNMPKVNGIEFLDALRKDPELSTAVIFVLTTSNDDRDRVTAYERHVAGYIVKSRPDALLQDAVAMLDHYKRVVDLP